MGLHWDLIKAYTWGTHDFLTFGATKKRTPINAKIKIGSIRQERKERQLLAQEERQQQPQHQHLCRNYVVVVSTAPPLHPGHACLLTYLLSTDLLTHLLTYWSI